MSNLHRDPKFLCLVSFDLWVGSSVTDIPSTSDLCLSLSLSDLFCGVCLSVYMGLSARVCGQPDPLELELDSCELPDDGAGNRTQSLWKGTQDS